jgi:hypothetical protein
VCIAPHRQRISLSPPLRSRYAIQGTASFITCICNLIDHPTPPTFDYFRAAGRLECPFYLQSDCVLLLASQRGERGNWVFRRTWRNDTRPLATCAPSVCCLVLHIIAIKIDFILTPMTILLFSNSVLLSTSFMLHQSTEPRAFGKSPSSPCYGDVADLAHLPGNDFHPMHTGGTHINPLRLNTSLAPAQTKDRNWHALR